MRKLDANFADFDAIYFRLKKKSIFYMIPCSRNERIIIGSIWETWNEVSIFIYRYLSLSFNQTVRGRVGKQGAVSRPQAFYDSC